MTRCSPRKRQRRVHEMLWRQSVVGCRWCESTSLTPSRVLPARCLFTTCSKGAASSSCITSVRPRRRRMAEGRVSRLFLRHRSHRSSRALARPQHDTRSRVARAAGQHQPLQTSDGLDGALVFLIGERLRKTVYRTYFTSERGVEMLGSPWSFLDLTPYKRQDTWEHSPAGWPQTAPYVWWRRHDEYGTKT